MMRITILTLATLALIGCGGGGSSSDAGTNPTPVGRSVQLFATDSVREDYSNVWVTLRRITAVTATGETTLVDHPNGEPIDVRALGTAAGRRFRLLGAASLPPGTTSLRVTVESAVLLVPSGSIAGHRVPFTGEGLTRTFDVPLGATDDTHVLLDFDLAHWNLSAGALTSTTGAFVRRVEDNRVDDPATHEAGEFKGTVAGLTGTSPDQKFTLGTLTVQMSASTVLFNNDGAANPVLSLRERVEVTGTLDPSTNMLQATSVKIENEQEQEAAEAKGNVAASDATAGSLTLTVLRAQGFVPSGTTVAVATTDATRYLTGEGTAVTREAFFALATVGAGIEAEGDYTDGALTAGTLKIEAENEHGDD